MSVSRRRFLQIASTLTAVTAIPTVTLATNNPRSHSFAADSASSHRIGSRLRNVLTLATYEAESLSTPYVGSEHLLLGLVAEAGMSNRKWPENLGAELDDFRCVVTRIFDDIRSSTDDSDIVNQCLSAAFAQADLMGYDLLQPEHLLLGLVEMEHSAAKTVFDEMWFEASAIRQEAFASLTSWSECHP